VTSAAIVWSALRRRDAGRIGGGGEASAAFPYGQLTSATIPAVDAPIAVARLVDSVKAAPGVHSVTLVGSRARGQPTALSDWDYLVEGASGDLLETLPEIPSGYDALACFWDPLSERAALMVVLPGPVKVDLITRAPNPERLIEGRAPSDSIDEIDQIDCHFWDWMLWLGAKSLAGKEQLVKDELAKMHVTLLAAIGVSSVPLSLDEAVDTYTGALHDRGLVPGSDRLASEVRRALRKHRLIS
jgi:hypothetical protein